MNIYWTDLKRFFIKHYKKMISLSIVFAIVLMGFIYLYKSNPSFPGNKEATEKQIETNENSEAAYFRFYIENQKGDNFNNPKMIEELFNLDETYQAVKDRTGINLLNRNEKEELIKELEDSQKDLDELKIISVEIGSSSNIYTAEFKTTDKKKSLKLAQFYSDYLETNEFDILDNKTVYFIEKPKNFDANEDIELAGMNEVDLLFIDKFVAIGLGIIASFLFVLFQELFSEKLNYGFSYNTIDSNHFLLVDLENKKSSDKNLLTEKLFANNQLVICENSSRNTIVAKNILQDVNTFPSLSSIHPNTQVDEIIILVISRHTNREWYNQQLKLAKLWELPTKIVQINSK